MAMNFCGNCTNLTIGDPGRCHCLSCGGNSGSIRIANVSVHAILHHPILAMHKHHQAPSKA
eukprot:5940065-Amphidinium_carterae.1